MSLAFSASPASLEPTLGPTAPKLTMGHKVRSLVRDLPRDERLAVLMFYADELTPLEIGVVMHKPTIEISQVLDRFRKRVGLMMDRKAEMPNLKLVRG